MDLRGGRIVLYEIAVMGTESSTVHYDTELCTGSSLILILRGGYLREICDGKQGNGTQHLYTRFVICSEFVSQKKEDFC